MTDAVLDASAVLAVINEEPGAEKVEAVLPGAAISVFNVAEVVAKLLDNGMPAEIAEAVIEGLQLDIIDGDLAQAFRNGRLRPVTRSAGLSLGDRACLALAQQLELPALTSDKVWQSIAEVADVQIVLIR